MPGMMPLVLAAAIAGALEVLRAPVEVNVRRVRAVGARATTTIVAASSRVSVGRGGRARAGRRSGRRRGACGIGRSCEHGPERARGARRGHAVLLAGAPELWIEEFAALARSGIKTGDLGCLVLPTGGQSWKNTIASINLISSSNCSPVSRKGGSQHTIWSNFWSRYYRNFRGAAGPFSRARSRSRRVR